MSEAVIVWHCKFLNEPNQQSRRMSSRPTRKWNQLNSNIERCTRCPRLIEYCRTVAVEKRAAFRDESYWGGPVANFGDSRARLLIVGLAPGAHGANRTRRMFTGDRSGDFLYRSLHKCGFANQPDSTDLNDGLALTDCAITNACHCAPPQNKPTSEELSECAPWFNELLNQLPVRIIVALGGIAWNTVWKHFKTHSADQLLPAGKPAFGHKAETQLTDEITLIGSYHPSQQNTFTGRLTQPMLNSVFRRARSILAKC